MERDRKHRLGARDRDDHHAAPAPGKSGGVPLPHELRGRFERSLGTDLSSVRVHTGGAPAEAARSLQAQAFTIGKDIYFNQGRYDPASASGRHLLAHEVAHTQQQMPAQPRLKSEVTQPHDACEVEADRAADRMVAGERATVSAMGTTIARRTETHAGELPPPPQPTQAPGAGDTTVIADISSAETWAGAIDAARGALIAAGAPTGNVVQNQSCINNLRHYVDLLSMQSTGMSQFQPMYKASMADYARIQAAVEGMRKMYPQANLDSLDGKGSFSTENFLQNAKQASGVTGGKTDKEDALDNARVDGGMDSMQAARQAIDGYRASAKEVNDSQFSFNQSTLQLQHASQLIDAGLSRPPSKDDDPHIRDVQGQMQQVRGAISKVMSAVQLAAKAAGAGAALEGGVTSLEEIKKAGNDAAKQLPEVPDSVVEAALDALFASSMQMAQSIDASDDARKAFAWSQSFQTEVTQAKTAISNSLSKYKQAVRDLQQHKEAMRNAIQVMGKQADKKTGGGKGFQMEAQILSETQAFVVQADVALEHGRKEKEQAGRADGQRKSITDVHSSTMGLEEFSGYDLPGQEPAGGMLWWSVDAGYNPDPDLDSVIVGGHLDGLVGGMRLRPHRVDTSRLHDMRQAMAPGADAQDALDKQLDDLQKKRDAMDKLNTGLLDSFYGG